MVDNTHLHPVIYQAKHFSTAGLNYLNVFFPKLNDSTVV